MFDLISKIFVTALVLLLVMSFAIWGVKDVIFSGTKNIVASVSGLDISKSEHIQAISEERKRVQSMFGKPLSEEEMMFLNLEKRALEKLIRKRLVDLEIDNLGIKIGDSLIVKWLRDNPQFQSVDSETGKKTFDKDRFQSYMRYMGQTEKTFIAQMKNDMAVNILESTLVASPIASSSEVNLLTSYKGEKRSAKILQIPSDYVKEISEPENAELISYYENKKDEFITPEYRNISYISVGVEDVKNKMDLSDERLRREYTNYSENFQPEQIRKLQQIFIPDEKTANEVISLLKEGKSFLKVAEEKANQDEKATLYGDVTIKVMKENGIFKNDVIEAIFSAEKDAYTSPQKSPLGWHVFRIMNISESDLITYEEAKEDLKKYVYAEEASDIIYELVGQIDDELAAGSTFEEIAAKLKLKITKTAAINGVGKRQDGIEVKNIPEYGDFLKTAFTLSQNEYSQIASSPDGLSYYVLRTDDIIPARQMALDEVRGIVTSAWKNEQRKNKLKEIAEKIAKEIKDSSDMKAIALENKAKKLNVSVTYSGDFYRSTANKDLIPAPLVKELFALKKGEVSNAYIRKDGYYVVAVLNSITPSDKEDVMYGVKAIKDDIKRDFERDILEQYMTYLRSKYKVEYVN